MTKKKRIPYKAVPDARSSVKVDEATHEALSKLIDGKSVPEPMKGRVLDALRKARVQLKKEIQEERRNTNAKALEKVVAEAERVFNAEVAATLRQYLWPRVRDFNG